MSKPGITLSVRGGNFRTGTALRTALAPGMIGAVQDAAQATKKIVVAATPVVSGRLKGGWFIVPPHWDGNVRLIASLGNTRPYLNRVNRTSKRNAGFIQRAVATAPPPVRAALKAGVVRWIPTVWGQTK